MKQGSFWLSGRRSHIVTSKEATMIANDGKIREGGKISTNLTSKDRMPKSVFFFTSELDKMFQVSDN